MSQAGDPKKDSAGTAQVMLQMMKSVLKQELSELDAAEHSNLGGYLGTVGTKVWLSWIPNALRGIAAAKTVALMIKNSPLLLKIMGKVSYKATVVSLEKTDARLLALASKAKTGAGLTGPEKAQQTALMQQTAAAARAIAANDAVGLQRASTAINQIL